MNKYYVSLVQNLCGYYVPVIAENDIYVRMWANKVLGKMWCSVYAEDYIPKLRDFNSDKVIGRTVVLTFEDGELYDNYI